MKFLTVSILIVCLVFSENSFGKSKTSLKAAKNKIYVIAHRGAHVGIPENSLAAYQKAIDLGCDFVEVDIRITSDGKFVSVHNSLIDAYADGKSGKVSEMTLAQLKDLDIGSKVGPEWKGTQIPTFEEILQLCKGKIGIYLDLKDAPVAELLKLIKKYDMEEDVVWYIPANYLLEMANVNELFGNSFIMPDPGPEKNLQMVLDKLKPSVIATDMGELSKSFIETVHKANAKVFVDEKKGTDAEWSKMIDQGVDGIQTDEPEKLTSFLKQ